MKLLVSEPQTVLISFVSLNLAVAPKQRTADVTSPPRGFHAEIHKDNAHVNAGIPCIVKNEICFLRKVHQ